MSDQRDSLDELLEGWASEGSNSVPSDLAQRIRRTVVWRKRRRQFAIGALSAMLLLIAWNRGGWLSLDRLKSKEVVHQEVEAQETNLIDLSGMEDRLQRARLAQLEMQFEIDQWKLEEQQQRLDALRFELKCSKASDELTREWIKDHVASR